MSASNVCGSSLQTHKISSVTSATSDIGIDCVKKFKQVMSEKGNQPYAVIVALTYVIQQSKMSTVQAVNEELSVCSENILSAIKEDPEHEDRTMLSLRALLRIYFRMAQKVDYERTISEIRQSIHIKGMDFAHHCLNTHTLIKRFSEPHLREGMTILIHSQSSVVQDVLKNASERGLKISVITTEGQPSNTGKAVKTFCESIGIPCTVIYDSAVPISMPKVDVIFVGCEAVLANGGIVNKIGTYSVALIAQHFQKPVYVFCESYKFTEEFPLSQDDVHEMLEESEGKDSLVKVDYTPPEHLDLFFTDMGIFTPSGISDELTQFFAN